MPRLKLPIRPKRRRQPLPDRLARIVVSRWWHPAAYLVLAVLIAGDVWWAAFPAALVSGALWGLHAYLAPLMEQDRQQRAARDAAVAEVAIAAGDLAAVARGIAVALRAVADAGTAVQDALRPTHTVKVNPSSNGSRQTDPGA